MTPESDLRARVERGATFLDQAEPRWWKRVEKQLEMADCQNCVLGQLYGDFFIGLRVLRVGVPWDEDHGFERAGTRQGGSYEDYSVLDRLWLEAIEARRADPDRYVP